MKDSFFRKALVAGGIFMFTGVRFGAFGAHTLKAKIDAYSMDIFEKGVFYQFIHGLGLLLAAVLLTEKGLKWVYRCFLLGVIGFSFSLYLLSCKIFLPELVVAISGPITPIGGIFLIVGWMVFAFHFWKMKNGKNNSVQ